MINTGNTFARRSTTMAMMATTVLAATGVTIATAATASAEPGVVYTTSASPALDKPGGNAVAVIDKGQRLLVNESCVPGSTYWCQVWSANIGSATGKWVLTNTLSFQPQGPVVPTGPGDIEPGAINFGFGF